jgi:T5SS/PEP-CTERM-associated repeat protein
MSTRARTVRAAGIIVLAAGILAAAALARADEFLSPTSDILPRNIMLTSWSDPTVWANGMFIRDLKVWLPDNSLAMPAPGSPPTTVSANVQTKFWYSTNSGATYNFASASATAQVRVNNALSSGGDGVPINLEMLSLNIAGGGLPAGVQIRENPTLQSSGSIAYTWRSEGYYRVNSYLYLAMELTTDGGATWAPAAQSRYVTSRSQPTVVAPTATYLPPAATLNMDWGTRIAFANGVVLQDVRIHDYSSSIAFPASGATSANTFSATLDAMLSTDGGATFNPLSTGGNISVSIQDVLDQGSGRQFASEMLAMTLSGGSLPSGFLIRESPIRASLGTATDAALVSGSHRISSFFDVFTELSTDGGQSWLPALGESAEFWLTAPPIEYSWTATPGGMFSTSFNWDPAGVPINTDQARFDRVTGAYTVWFDQDEASANLFVDRGSPKFDFQGHTYSLSNYDSAYISSNTFLPRLTITNGTVQGWGITVAGWDPADRGELVVSTGGKWSGMYAPLTIGQGGQGKVTVENGGVLENGHGWAADYEGSRANVLVTGFGSLWNCTGSYQFGLSGTAEMVVADGGTARFGTLEMALYPGSQSTANVSGSGSLLSITGWDDYGLVIGGEGDALVSVTGGGRLTAPYSGVMIGRDPGGTGTLLVSGAGSRATLDGALSVGGAGTGNLIISEGGVVTCAAAYLDANGPGPSQGYATVDGIGSTWTVTDSLYVGNLNPVFGEVGSLTVTGGGRVNVGGSMQVSSVGTVELRDGKISAGSVQVDDGGMVQIEKGTFEAPGGFTNNGIVQMLSPLAKIATGTLSNNGILGGRGGILGNLNNGESGLVKIGTGEELDIMGSSHTNAGDIVITGGGAMIGGDLQNTASGNIFCRGSLGIFGTLANEGGITFSGGVSELFMDELTNAPGAKVTVTGNSTTTFGGDVHNDGLIWVRTGSLAIFTAKYSGVGSLDGGGTWWIEGELSPGDSPAAVDVNGDLAFGPQAMLVMELGGLAPGSQYDQLNISGEFAADGTLAVKLLNGFTPLAGQEFDLLNFDSLDGAFDSISLPALGSGLSWDTSALYTSGTVGVVPEPATLALVGLGLLAAIRRKLSR